MRHIPEPRQRIFWDNNVWMCLLELGNDAMCEREQSRRALLRTYLSSFHSGFAGIVFSPCLLADKPKDVVLSQFLAKVGRFEEAGYAVVLEPSSDWNTIAELREDMHRDIQENPAFFESVPKDKRKAGLGDTTVVYAALVTQCDELWTYDPLLLKMSERRAVRGLRIVEPHPLTSQGVLDLDDLP